MKTMRQWRSLLSYGLVVAMAANLMAAVLPTTFVHAAAGDVLINEINWAGSQGRPGDEWIELYNPTAGTTVDFATNPHTLTIFDEAGAVDQTIVLGATTPSLNAGEYLIIRNNEAGTTLNTAAAGVKYYEPVIPFTDLPNERAAYVLTDSFATEVDALKAPVGGVIPFAGATPTTTRPASSMERVYTGGVAGDGTLQSSWRTSMTRGVNFNAGVIQYGTPGAENLVVMAPHHLTVTPAGTATDSTTVTLSGMVEANVTSVDLELNRQGPVTSTTTVSVLPSAGDFSSNATLLPGRYQFTATARDAAGNQSPVAYFPVAPGSTELNYVVTATTSTLATPVLNALPAITNQPTATITGTVDPMAVEVDILRNGEYLQTSPVSGGSLNATVFLQPNVENTFKVIAVAADGTVSVPASLVTVHDNIAPTTIPVSKVTVESNAPGTQDRLIGQAGAAEPGTRLNVYSDAALTKLVVGNVLVAADGSFGPLLIGDNLYTDLYLRLTDAAGNMSGVTAVKNATSFTGSSTVLEVRAVTIQQNQATFAWNAVSGAVNYRVMYKVAGGQFGAPITVCSPSSPSCKPEVTLINLQSGTAYIVAVAPVDAYGNVGSFSELAFETAQPAPVAVVTTPQAAATDSIVRRPRTTVTPVPQTVVTPEPTATPEASPETGEVKSTAEEAARNWTPWIVLAIMIGFAALATLGYLYWFGGDAGASALASAESARERTERIEEEKASAKKKPEAPEKPSNPEKPKRW